jgi:hypothetical protein
LAAAIFKHALPPDCLLPSVTFSGVLFLRLLYPTSEGRFSENFKFLMLAL